jgi:phthiodiolone/phenolphthiodiolone dimycocerosates ketoreductase
VNRPLRIGMYGSFFPPVEQAVEQAVLCESFGLDVVAFTDQMSGNVPNSAFRDLQISQMWSQQHGFYDAMMLAALTAARTEHIGITIAAIDTVRNAPTRLAQQILTLDHLSKGRTTTGLGVSEAKNLLQYGHPRVGAGQKFIDASRIIRRILDNPSKPIYYDGERYSMKGGVVDLTQYGDQTARIYAACGSSSDNIDVIGECYDGMMTVIPSFCQGGVDQFAEDVAHVRSAAERHDRDPSRLGFAAVCMVLMHDDPDVVDRIAHDDYLRWNTYIYGCARGSDWDQHGFTHPGGPDYGYARHLVPERMTKEQFFTEARKVSPEAVKQVGHLTGTAEQVADRLKPYIEAGLDELILIDHAAAGDLTLAQDSAANLGRLVARLRGGQDAPSMGLGYVGLANTVVGS